MPRIGSEKLRIEVFAGGVSEIVRLSFVLPPPLQSVQEFFNPLQELRVTLAANAIKRRDLFKFMHTPHDRTRRTIPDRTQPPGIPQHTVAPGRKAYESETARVPNY